MEQLAWICAKKELLPLFLFSIFTWLTGWKNRGRPDLVLAHHHSSTAVSASLRWHVGHDTVLLLKCCQSITHLQPSSLFLKIKPRKHIWYALLMCALMACLNLISEIRNVLYKWQLGLLGMPSIVSALQVLAVLCPVRGAGLGLYCCSLAALHSLQWLPPSIASC